MKPPPKRHSVGGKLLIETVKHGVDDLDDAAFLRFTAERGETPDETASWKLPTLQYPTAKGSGLPSTAMHTTVLRRRAGRPSSWWLKETLSNTGTIMPGAMRAAPSMIRLLT